MNENVGIQDQCAASFGGLVYINADKEGVKPRRFLCKPEYLNYIESSLLMGFTGIQRFSSVASKKVTAAINKREYQERLNELYQISQEGIDAFAKEADIHENARLTKKLRDIKLQITGDIENRQIMELIEETEKAGSLCTRLMGAGGGGFFLCWAPESKHEYIKERVNVKTWVKVRFSNSGCQVILTS